MRLIDLYSQTEIMPKYGNILTSVKELDTLFIGKGEVRGFEFKQLHKSDKAYMYEKSNAGSISYEVFERRINKLYGTVTYPSSKSFGLWAWDYIQYDKALRKFQELSNRTSFL